jgi:hypothetical protein
MKTVFAQVLQKNTTQFFGAVHKEHINAGDGTITEGVYWFIPRTVKGRLTTYKPVIQTAKPSIDSVRAIRVRDTITGNVYYVAIADNASATLFSDTANGCCGTDNTMPTVTIPAPLLEETACGNSTDGFTYFDVPPALLAGETYVADGSADGVRFAPASNLGGHDSLAAFVTWATANWSAYGTFIQASGKVTFTSATKKTGFIKLVRSKYFESNAPAGLSAGQHYIANATIDGSVLPTLTGANNAALQTVADAANANPTWAAYGTWMVVGGKIRLVNTGTSITTVSSFVITIA